MRSPSLEPAAAASPVPRAAAFGRVRVAHGARGPRGVAGAGVAGTAGRLRVLVAALPEPLLHRLMPAQEGAAALSPEADEVQGGVASAEISSPPAPAVPGSTVRVRFVLKEQCTFGQSFHLVGDVPALGLWEPTNAVAMDWLEGHDWTVEKDLPANRLIEFKFLLQDSLGKFHWQNGPNRSLQTGETTKTLVVYEDWGNAKNQKVAEEGHTPVQMMETVVNDDHGRNGVVSAHELQVCDNQEIKEDESTISDDDNSMAAAIASVGEETMKACEADQPELLMGEQKIQDELRYEIDTAPQNGRATTYADADGEYDETTDDDSILPKNGALVKHGLAGAFERELLWGWKALQQLVGFKADT
ncbi:unnamed protein product [Triticum turgidum subsp. durum]|uniref:CBM20 domain-containing protein n=1 Tax=Triticum turgidum subsp. durum TaxID=4567 RepID=A0A9R0V0R0_TRITD|nr:unnamed protein product [Triticum turgidum subsp. durum]